MTNRRVKTKQGVDEEEKRKNRTKSRVRAKVEWPFRILKRVFGYTKVRYRGIKKNHALAAGGLRAGQSLPTPQAADSAIGPAGGVVSLEAGNGLQTRQNRPLKPLLSTPCFDHGEKARRRNAAIAFCTQKLWLNQSFLNLSMEFCKKLEDET